MAARTLRLSSPCTTAGEHWSEVVDVTGLALLARLVPELQPPGVRRQLGVAVSEVVQDEAEGLPLEDFPDLRRRDRDDGQCPLGAIVVAVAVGGLPLFRRLASRAAHMAASPPRRLGALSRRDAGPDPRTLIRSLNMSKGQLHKGVNAKNLQYFLSREKTRPLSSRTPRMAETALRERPMRRQGLMPGPHGVMLHKLRILCIMSLPIFASARWRLLPKETFLHAFVNPCMLNCLAAHG